MGLKEDILGHDDRATATFEVPEWKRSVTIRAFTGEERDEWEGRVQVANKAGKPLKNFRASLAAMIVVDEKGDRAFADADAAALGKKSGKALDRIFDAFLKLNKMAKDEVEELEKNSSATPTDA